MKVDRRFFDPALIAFSAAKLLSSILIMLIVDRPYKFKNLKVPNTVQYVIVSLIGGSLSYILTWEWRGSVLATAFLMSGMVILGLLLPRLNAPGVIEKSITISIFPLITPWTILWLQETTGMPHWVIITCCVVSAISVLILPLSFIINFPENSMLTHCKWERPNGTTKKPTPPQRKSGNMVSIHLCCYAEPPDMVIESLEALSKLEYERYEVIVMDNNTPEPEMWMPLRDYCVSKNFELGKELFKFYHESNMTGAKAGALNYCLQKTHPDSKFIGLVDADYKVEPEFISNLIGYFDDESIGYVQTPHCYRDVNESFFKYATFWQYFDYYSVTQPSYSEYNMPITVGTMCIYRRVAIEMAGPWAEWCLVEDSEMSIRIHHVGYDGIFLNKVLGYGLVPECFTDLRKQRFRWTAGPVKTLLHHFRMYISAIFLPKSTKMKLWQKVLLYRQSAIIFMPFVYIGSILLGVVTVSLNYYGILPRIQIPRAAFQSFCIGIPSLFIWKLAIYKLAGAKSVMDMIWGTIARASLTGVACEAVLVALLHRKPLPWVRTPKFEMHEPQYVQALLRGAPLETSLALLFTLLSFYAWMLRQYIGNIALLFFSTYGVMALVFYCTIIMVLLGEACKSGEEPTKAKGVTTSQISDTEGTSSTDKSYSTKQTVPHHSFDDFFNDEDDLVEITLHRR